MYMNTESFIFFYRKFYKFEVNILMLEVLKFFKPVSLCFQDLSRLRKKIDRLERLLRNNNRLVATLRDSLIHNKASWETAGGGANVSSDSAHNQADPLPGCRLAEEMKDGTDGVQVSLAC